MEQEIFQLASGENKELNSLSKATGEFYDDVHGGILDPAGVRAARKEEMGYVKWHKVYDKVRRAQAKKAGIRPIRVRWVDTNKGTLQNPMLRSRLVAM